MKVSRLGCFFLPKALWVFHRHFFGGKGRVRDRGFHQKAENNLELQSIKAKTLQAGLGFVAGFGLMSQGSAGLCAKPGQKLAQTVGNLGGRRGAPLFINACGHAFRLFLREAAG